MIFWNCETSLKFRIEQTMYRTISISILWTEVSSCRKFIIGHVVFSTCTSHPFALFLLLLCAAEGTEVSGQNRGRVIKALLFPDCLLKTWGLDFCPDTSCCYMGYYYPEGHLSGHTIELSSRRGQIIHILMQKRGHHWGQSIIFFFPRKGQFLATSVS